MKIVYQLTNDGYYAGEVVADESPLEPGVFLIPAGCVEEKPPAQEENKVLRYVNNEWVQQELPPPVQPEEQARKKTYADLRRESYPSLMEYIDGIVKGDQAQVEKYISDCLAVKEKYPKPQE